MSEEKTAMDAEYIVPTFARTMEKHGLALVRRETEILQINTGFRCNLSCVHCHLEAGPDRTEIMDEATMREVAAYAGRFTFRVIDVTGGAPELMPNIEYLIAALAPCADKLIFRTNLAALLDNLHLADILKTHGYGIVASFPSGSASRTDAQRGNGFFSRALEGLRMLNSLGYGLQPELELDLASNPSGAFLAQNQCEEERRLKIVLERKYGIFFNNLFCLNNVPLGGFRNWLKKSGNYRAYMKKLVDSFNPLAVANLMCRSLVSIGWDGRVYDCDFNLALRRPSQAFSGHVRDLSFKPSPGTPIAMGEHCYACTAGSGFT